MSVDEKIEPKGVILLQVQRWNGWKPKREKLLSGNDIIDRANETAKPRRRWYYYKSCSGKKNPLY